MGCFSLKKRLAIVCAVTGLIFSGRAWADSFMPIPDQYMVCSNSKNYCAVFDKENGVRAYKVTNSISIPMWHLSKQVWPGYLSNGGRYLVEGERGLIPVNYNKQMTIITVYHDGKLHFILNLRDLIKDFRSLKRTVSHFHWGESVGFDKKGRFVVETVENRRLAINVKTGNITAYRIKAHP